MTDAFERAAQRIDSQHRHRRRERSARHRRKGFRIHATVFVAVQILLVAIWALQWQLGGTSHPWFLYVLLGWGVGLAAHYAATRKDLGAPAARHDES
jgi:2TM domain-containing protein